MRLLEAMKRWFSRKKETPPPVEIGEDDSAPGWEAIDGDVQPLYPDQEPQHWGTLLRWMLGGPDPLDGVSAYRADGPPPHWHFVSYGMSDLYRKESEDPSVSGWGFEFTFRLLRANEEETAPIWAVNFLQNLGRYVFDSGAPFGHGHYIDCNGPIAAETTSELRAVLFLPDPQLPPISTPHGSLEFLQIIGITVDELEACRGWNSESFDAVMQERNPLFVTDLARTSLLNDPAIARRVAEGQERDGSSSDASHMDTLTWRADGGEIVITMTPKGAQTMPLYLRGRLLHGREFFLLGKEQWVTLKPSTTSSVSRSDDMVTIELTDDDVRRLASTIAPTEGVYRVEGLNVAFEVLPSVQR